MLKWLQMAKKYIFRVATLSGDTEIFDQLFPGINLFGRWELRLVFFSLGPYQYTTIYQLTKIIHSSN